jgi:3-oxoacyl-[acyl-carrier protein] reductase
VISTGGGSVVNISSVAGLVGSGGGAASTASKHGVIGLTKDLFHGEGSEAVVATASAVPARRRAQPEEVANPALFPASDEASFVYAGVYMVDGGMTTP